jgi:hypothetical protein
MIKVPNIYIWNYHNQTALYNQYTLIKILIKFVIRGEL